MQKSILTDITIRKLKPPSSGQKETWDGKIPGFGVRVSSSGTKSFVLMYRFKGKARRQTLGRYPTISLAEARVAAQDILNQTMQGTDPKPAPVIDQNLHIFESTVASFVRHHCARHNKPITQRDTARILKNRFTSRWAKRDIRDISKAEVLAVLDGIVEEGFPSAANHAFAAIRKFFNWCVERGLLDYSPCTGIKKPSKDKSKDRVLDDSELVSIWQAAGMLHPPFSAIIQLLMLTAQRRAEVANMRWNHIDLEEKIWSIPPQYTKNNRLHTLPLTPAVIDIISSLPRHSGDLVFPSRTKQTQCFTDFSGGKRRLDRFAMVQNWTLHDLRRSAATHLARLETLPHVVERILNHSSGSFGGVAGIYNRFSYLPEMRKALCKWEQHIESLLT